jgi:hypothetical protein
MIKFVQLSLFQGVVELAAVGVSISTFNLVSRMFNMPLLNVTTSFVADDASKENRVNLSSEPASPTLPGILWFKLQVIYRNTLFYEVILHFRVKIEVYEPLLLVMEPLLFV